MRVRSKNHAVALRDDSAKFYNQFGSQAQGSSQGSVRSDQYKAALKHLYNAINGFDYLFDAQLGALERKVSLLEAEKHRLEHDVKTLQKTLRVMKGNAAPRVGQPEQTNTASVGLRQDRRSNGTVSHARKMMAHGPSSATTVATPLQVLHSGARNVAKALPDPRATLLRYLLQGQRNFLDQHNDAGVAGALSFLIQHALIQLQAAPVARSIALTQQAMYANLYTICKKLRTYRGQALNGFQSALEELETHIPGIADLAAALPVEKQKRSEARLFLEMLKLLRDQARLDFRPYFYEIDPDEGTVFTVG